MTPTPKPQRSHIFMGASKINLESESGGSNLCSWPVNVRFMLGCNPARNETSLDMFGPRLKKGTKNVLRYGKDDVMTLLHCFVQCLLWDLSGCLFQTLFRNLTRLSPRSKEKDLLSCWPIARRQSPTVTYLLMRFKFFERKPRTDLYSDLGPVSICQQENPSLSNWNTIF